MRKGTLRLKPKRGDEMELLPGSVPWEVTRLKVKGNSLGPEKTFSLIATGGKVIPQRQSLVFSQRQQEVGDQGGHTTGVTVWKNCFQTLWLRDSTRSGCFLQAFSSWAPLPFFLPIAIASGMTAAVMWLETSTLRPERDCLLFAMDLVAASNS